MNEDEALNTGIGSIFSSDFEDTIRFSALPSPTGRAIYGDQPTFMEKLVNRFDYPTVESNRFKFDIIPPGTPPERFDYLPNFEEVLDARKHMIGSALANKQVGGTSSKILGYLREGLDLFKMGTIGTPEDKKRDFDMDIRNNAVGRMLFKKAGIDATNREIINMVDEKIFEQIERLKGRKKLDRRVEEGQPQLYFPRDEQGRYSIQYNQNY
tara:strand:- start:112 stop:744 length:633 start_codon:yes stop_codon:yes gene_type:complete